MVSPDFTLLRSCFGFSALSPIINPYALCDVSSVEVNKRAVVSRLNAVPPSRAYIIYNK